MCQKQFSYNSNSSEFCGLLIYSAFQQYITKNWACVALGHTQALNLSELWNRWKMKKIHLLLQMFLFLLPKYQL